MKKFKDWLMIVLIALLTCAVIITYLRHFKDRMPYVECDEYIAYKMFEDKDKQQIISEINELTGTNYNVIWVDTNEFKGRSDLFNNIWLASNMSCGQIAWIYTHEIMHKVKFSSIERYVQFETFKTLYESGDEWYKNVALWQANLMRRGYIDYDCTWYVVQYLEGENENKFKQ